MLRKLLTLFVLLSGLAAAGAPAQARVTSLDEVRLEASSSLSSPCAVSRQASQHLSQLPLVFQRAGGVCRRPVTSVTLHVPAVMLGIDRARE